MRFTNNIGLLQTLKYSSQRLTRIMTVPITNGYRKLRRVLNPNGFTTRVMADVRKGSKELIGGKPQSLRDYFAFGNLYVAKKLVFIVILLAFVLPIVYLKFLHPIIRTSFLTVTMPVNSAEMVGYSGKVRLTYSRGGKLLYQGALQEGRISGEGLLYDQGGSLLYQGGFLMEQYEGRGQEFWSNGKLRYVGDFASNRYEGRGIFYEESGRMLYDGSFAAGQYSGEGVLHEEGRLFYQGGFQNGLMEGAGKLYAGSKVIYDGSFAAGTFSGAGRAYDPVGGRLLYDGEYVAGQYEGAGKRFDAKTGNLIYEGGFYQGEYAQTGKLYNPATQLPLYEGGFRAGRYDGEGVEYDAALGAVIYRGGFLLGAYHGKGTQYDPITGFVLAGGEYRNGQQVVLDANGKIVGEPPTAPEGSTGDTAGGGTTADNQGDSPQPDADPTQPVKPPSEGGKKAYQGPTTAAGGVDYLALAKLPTAKNQFAISSENWDVPGGQVLIFSDKTEGLGVALRTDSGGRTVSVDVWNDAPVAGAKAGMTKAELGEALGKPSKTTQEAMGTGRMFSISQSNRYFGRLTNLSPDTQVTVQTYETPAGVIRAIFAGKREQCLLLEILP